MICANPFDALNTIEKDDELGSNGGIQFRVGVDLSSIPSSSNVDSKKADDPVDSDSDSEVYEAFNEKFYGLERLIIDGKLTLVDDEGKPIEKVDYSGDHDSEDEVEPVDNEMAYFLVLNLSRVGYGTNSLLE
ncbi:hypothetical protein Tco_0691110 [Tanacetum coccineum]